MAGNVGIFNGTTVDQYIFADWVTSEESAPRQRFRPWRISVWGELAFLYSDGPGQVGNQLFSVDQSGVLHERSLPPIDAENGPWRELEVYEGRQIVMASPHTSIGRRIFESDNLIDWTDISLPEDTWTSHLIGAGSTLYAIRNGVRTFDGAWSDPVPLPNRLQDVIFNPARDALISYGEWDGIAHLQRLEPDGTATLITEYQRDPGITTFKKLYCPAGSLLIVVWEDAGVFLVDMENHIQALNLQGKFSEQDSEIENITAAKLCSGVG